MQEQDSDIHLLRGDSDDGTIGALSDGHRSRRKATGDREAIVVVQQFPPPSRPFFVAEQREQKFTFAVLKEPDQELRHPLLPRASGGGGADSPQVSLEVVCERAIQSERRMPELPLERGRLPAQRRIFRQDAFQQAAGSPIRGHATRETG